MASQARVCGECGHTFAAEVRLIDYYENHGVGLDHYVKWIKDNDYLKAEHILPHDVRVRELGTGKSRMEMLEEAGLEVKIAPRMGLDDGIGRSGISRLGCS